MTAFHFLRPWWLVLLLPLIVIGGLLWKQKAAKQAWEEVCDPYLLVHLINQKGQNKRHTALMMLVLSGFFMILSLSGPTWSRYPVPSYKQVEPRVVVLDLSDAMNATDLAPSRLARAKFKLQDLFKSKDVGQFGLLVYSGEPFIVSPLTDDAQTILALLPSLTPDVLPVHGQNLDAALKEAGVLIKNAGFVQGDILVLTPESPGRAAIKEARSLARERIHTSILPIRTEVEQEGFASLANAGGGQQLRFTDSSEDINRWLEATGERNRVRASMNDDVPVWRDQGRWFLIPALLLLLPTFRRGWLQRIHA